MSFGDKIIPIQSTSIIHICFAICWLTIGWFYIRALRSSTRVTNYTVSGLMALPINYPKHTWFLWFPQTIGLYFASDVIPLYLVFTSSIGWFGLLVFKVNNARKMHVWFTMIFFSSCFLFVVDIYFQSLAALSFMANILLVLFLASTITIMIGDDNDLNNDLEFSQLIGISEIISVIVVQFLITGMMHEDFNNFWWFVSLLPGIFLVFAFLLEFNKPLKWVHYKCRLINKLTNHDCRHFAEKNHKNDISGVLFVEHGFAFQYIEGPRRKMKQLIENIQADDRQTQFEVISEGTSFTRKFQQWHMKYIIQ